MINSIRTLGFTFLFLPFLSLAQPTNLPWLSTIAPKVNLNEIQTISTQANVTVSDGLTYQTHTLYHDPQRAIFKRTYADRTVVQGLEGKYVWTYDGTSEKEASAFIGKIILGHQFHAQILFLDKLHSLTDSLKTVEFNNKQCKAVSSNSDGQYFEFYFQEEGRPLGFTIFNEEEDDIIFKFADWRKVAEVDLPFAVDIDDGKRIFQYKFTEIKFNEGSIADYSAPDSLLTEEQKLLRCHRVIMDGHLFGITDGIKAQQADTMAMLNAGEIFMVEGRPPVAMIDRIMSNRDYFVYDDLIRPMVEVSEDGTLGWVIATLYANGIRFDENGQPTDPIEFTCSWVELYEKVNRDWKLKGIASTFLPDP